jgi:hypothetical protein
VRSPQEIEPQGQALPVEVAARYDVGPRVIGKVHEHEGVVTRPVEQAVHSSGYEAHRVPDRTMHLRDAAKAVGVLYSFRIAVQ